MPPGYSIENYYAPNNDDDQLFEALGLNNQGRRIIIASRNAGIWRLVNGEWRFFAEGLFDSLGVVVEGIRIVVVAGQKAELTRISDTNGDGIADQYTTLFDARSYHANYHTYMHGPVRGGDGAYYFALNLVHDDSGPTYTAGGNVIGVLGVTQQAAVRVEPSGESNLFPTACAAPQSVGRVRRPRVVHRQPG